MPAPRLTLRFNRAARPPLKLTPPPSPRLVPRSARGRHLRPGPSLGGVARPRAMVRVGTRRRDLERPKTLRAAFAMRARRQLKLTTEFNRAARAPRSR